MSMEVVSHDYLWRSHKWTYIIKAFHFRVGSLSIILLFLIKAFHFPVERLIVISLFLIIIIIIILIVFPPTVFSHYKFCFATCRKDILYYGCIRHYAFAVDPVTPNTCSLRSYLPCYRKACVQINYETVKDFAIKVVAKWSAMDCDNLLHIAQSILTTPCRSYFPLFIGSKICTIVTHEPEVI